MFNDWTALTLKHINSIKDSINVPIQTDKWNMIPKTGKNKLHWIFYAHEVENGSIDHATGSIFGEALNLE